MTQPGANAEVVTETPDSPISDGDDDAKLIAGMKEKGLIQEKPEPDDPELRADLEASKKAAKDPTPTEKEPVAAKEEEKKDPPPAKPSMDLVHQARERARIERQQKERDADIEAEVERRVQRRAGEQRQQRPPEDTARLKQFALQNPMEFYRSLGADPNDIMTVMAAAELGKEVPANLRPLQHQMSLKAQYDERIEAMQKQIDESNARWAQYQQQNQVERARAEVKAEIKNFLTAIPERLNLVAKQYERNPSRALEKIWDLTHQYASLYPDDTLPTPEEAAEWYQAALEEELGPWLEELKAKAAPTPPPPPKPEPKRQVSSSDVAGRSSPKDELPFDDDEKLDEILTSRLKRGVHLPQRQ